jgi:hypothetical protein
MLIINVKFNLNVCNITTKILYMHIIFSLFCIDIYIESHAQVWFNIEMQICIKAYNIDVYTERHWKRKKMKIINYIYLKFMKKKEILFIIIYFSVCVCVCSKI